MNMRSIAKLAGVSLSTVSKAFSGSREISEATRQRIFDIAKEYELYDIYNKNKFEKKVIAVIYPEVLNDFYSEAITILNEEITSKGGIMLSSITQFKIEKTKELINYYTAYSRVDGIICVCPAVDLVNPSLIPGVVIFGGSHKYDGWTSVRTDLRSSLVDAVLELKRLGHTDIGFACETTTKGKLEDFKYAMRNASLPLRAEWIAKSSNRFEIGGAEIADSWISSGRIPSAVICSNDYKAIGAMNKFKAKGFRVPEDISIIGIDDIRQAAFAEPPLTTVRTCFDEVCRKCVEIIMQKIDNQYYSPLDSVILPTKLIMRSSVAGVRERQI